MPRLLPLSPLDGESLELVECQVGDDIGGNFDHLRIVAMQTRPPPGTDEVEIQVRAVGLNFRDVLNGMGFNLGVPGPLGADCAGVVSQVGSNVQEWRVGDEVLGIARGCLRSYALTNQSRLLRKPATLTFEQAASIPSVLSTVWHSLVNVAGLRRGQTILIHAAAGGVGLCAIQLAQHLGARVVATVGNPEKARLVQSYGVQFISNSRDVSLFEADLRSWCIKPDVVLNCLTGEYIRASLESLASPGIFIELGKREIWTRAQLSAVRGGNDVQYTVVAIDKLLAEHPLDHAKLLRDIEKELQSDAWYRPIPVQTFPFRMISQAFASMRHGQHVGKVVLQLHSPESSTLARFSTLGQVHQLERELRSSMDNAVRDFFSTRFNRDELEGGLAAADAVARSYLTECVARVHSSQVTPHLRALHAAYAQPSLGRNGPPTTSLLRDARAKYPSIQARLDFLEHVSRSHADILSGKTDPVAVLFSDPALTGRLYDESPLAALFNPVVEAAFAAVKRAISQHGAIRLKALEIGSGTGGTTRAVSNTLRALCQSFCFTDMSTSFFARAQQEFGGKIPGFSTALLNIEQDPERQGFVLASYDTILAANVLHATADLAVTLTNVCSLLKPGGILVLSELTAPSVWADATFGMTEGWWRSTDERRGGHPLIGVARWNDIFRRVGLEPLACSDESITAQAVMVARRPTYQPSLAPGLRAPLDIGQGVFVITGGTGGLGLLTAWVLVLQGARRIALLSRSGRVPGEAEAAIWETLQRSRARVTVHRCDVGVDLELTRVLRSLDAPVVGIIHAAGHLRDASIGNQSESTFGSVMNTKAVGLLNLHRASLQMPSLCTFVVFSSAAAFFGSPGQTNHAAANSFMDNLVRWRRRKGLPASSIMWGAVSQVGDAARRGADQRARMLYDPLSLNDAIHAISSVLFGDLDVVLAAPIRPAAIESDYKGNKRIFSKLLEAPGLSEFLQRNSSDSSVPVLSATSINKQLARPVSQCLKYH